MPEPAIDLAAHQMLAVSRAALAALRDALHREGHADAASLLREAGYGGGEDVWSAFVEWVAREGNGTDPAQMSIEEFESLASAYFRATGWGSLTLGALRDSVAVVDAAEWGEADPTSGLEEPGCHFTTGMLADFFGRVSEVPLAVLEVECRSAGAPRCRFLLGTGEVMTYVYGEMSRGVDYETAVARVEHE